MLMIASLPLKTNYSPMKKLSLLLFLLITVKVNAQEAIQFNKVKGWKEGLEKSAKEDKLIFVDGYTSWCAPCKWMEGNVFNQPEVANFYNANFINMKFDCEVGEGIDIAKKYGILSFPTYLFVNSKGELVYRAQSRMEVQAFMTKGKEASNKDFHIPVVQARFKAGDKDPVFLLRYIKVMNSVDTKQAQVARVVLDSLADEIFLQSKIGWQAIMQLGRSDKDKYGRFFLNNKPYFKKTAPEDEYLRKDQEFLRYAMYGYVSSKNKEEFDKGIAFLEQGNTQDNLNEAAMFKVDWVAKYGTDAEFVELTNQLRKGVLKEQSENLSFIARRYAGKKSSSQASKAILDQCYILAKQAVKLDGDNYSNQVTLAEICISLKKKKEAVMAAEAGRLLAEAQTSKIIKLAQEILDRAKNI